MNTGAGEVAFPLSKTELERLQKHASALGLPPNEIALEVANNAEFKKAMRFLFPKENAALDAVFPDDKSHFTLNCKTEENSMGNHCGTSNTLSRCVFLGEEGCRIPAEDRPRYCRLFPFWVSNWHQTANGKADGSVDCFVSPDCLATQEAVGIEEMQALFGVTAAEIKAFYLLLRKEWGMPNLSK